MDKCVKIFLLLLTHSKKCCLLKQPCYVFTFALLAILYMPSRYTDRVRFNTQNMRTTHSPLGSYSLPGDTRDNSCSGPGECSSNRCRCGCLLRWRVWPWEGCWEETRPCSSGEEPLLTCPESLPGTRGKESSRDGRALSSSPAVSRPPPPPPRGMHCRRYHEHGLVFLSIGAN